MDHISCRGTDDRSLVFFDELNALNSGIRSLVKLSRKEFYRKRFCFLLLPEILLYIMYLQVVQKRCHYMLSQMSHRIHFSTS